MCSPYAQMLVKLVEIRRVVMSVDGDADWMCETGVDGRMLR